MPGIEEEKDYPFQTMKLEQRKYKIFGLVTNMDWEGGELIRWHYKRCGKSEEAHSVMKEDLVGGTLDIEGQNPLLSQWNRVLISVM